MANEITKQYLDGALDRAVESVASMVARGFEEVKEENKERFHELHERVDGIEGGQRLIVQEMESGFAAITQRFEREDEEKGIIKETLSNHETRLRRLEA